MFGGGTTPPVSATETALWTAGGRSHWEAALGQGSGLCVLGLGPLSVAASARSSWAGRPLGPGLAEDRDLLGLGWDGGHIALSGSLRPPMSSRTPKAAPGLRPRGQAHSELWSPIKVSCPSSRWSSQGVAFHGIRCAVSVTGVAVLCSFSSFWGTLRGTSPAFSQNPLWLVSWIHLVAQGSGPHSWNPRSRRGRGRGVLVSCGCCNRSHELNALRQ